MTDHDLPYVGEDSPEGRAKALMLLIEMGFFDGEPLGGS
jgi:hypothetical protein